PPLSRPRPPPPLPIRFPPPLSPPQPRRFHPAPQGLGRHCESGFFRQVFRRQRGSEICVASAHLIEHRLAKCFRVGSIRDAPAVAVLQGFRAPAAIPCPHPFDLPIAQPQQLRRLFQPQAARLYPPHNLDTTQFFAAQSTSPQSECLLSKAL